jgi:N-glycosylase/DNA lyase
MTIQFDYFQSKNAITIKDIDIDLANTLFSGQAFRWKQSESSYVGVCYNRVIVAKKHDDDLILENVDLEFFEQKLAHYFDLYNDYEQILNHFKNDDVFKKSQSFAPGIRVLNQQPFETLISFIISANNNLKRIRTIIDNLCNACGEKIRYDDHDYFAFPTPRALSNLSVEAIKKCGAGYRAAYIKQTATMVADGFDLEALKDLPYLVARKSLCTLMGVGTKVADCVLLYSLGFRCAFPMDVWVKRVIYHLYGFEPQKDSDILAFVEKTFGENAGIAQQYLFYYVKENKIGVK